jgi:hypothetical protein
LRARPLYRFSGSLATMPSCCWLGPAPAKAPPVDCQGAQTVIKMIRELRLQPTL